MVMGLQCLYPARVKPPEYAVTDIFILEHKRKNNVVQSKRLSCVKIAYAKRDTKFYHCDS